MKVSKMRRIYLREATVTLILAMLSLRIVSHRHIFAWATRSPHRICRFAADEVRWVSWAVETAAARGLIAAACLPRALAACAMLRRRGIPCRLHLGVARNGENLAAHAWVEVEHEKVVGGMEADRFTPIAEFGSTTS